MSLEASPPGGKIDAEQVHILLQTFNASRWTGGAPKPWLAWQRDREICMLFEGTTSIGPEEALARGQAIVSGCQPKIVGRLLKWARRADIVGFDEARGGPRWELRRHGVTFIPRGKAGKGWPGSVDVRLDLPTGGMSVGALSAREAKRRDRMRRSTLDWMLEAMLQHLFRLDRDAALPLELTGNDLPPVDTIGELRTNLDDFVLAMPIWRVAEILDAIRRLPPRSDPSAGSAAAEELADFKL